MVAIADVSHYVRPGTALNAEAVRRATSVYFPMQVLPMLPERLSNGICSLNPDVDRLCMVADMVVDSRGETRATEVYAAVMRSAARCTYTEVARVLDGEHVPSRERFRPSFEQMAELQDALGAMRRRRGSIDFDLAESRIVLDPDGNVVGIEKRPRNRAHRIVEEFMLAANEAVARFFGSRKLPTIYRVHGEPDEEKLANLPGARARPRVRGARDPGRPQGAQRPAREVQGPRPAARAQPAAAALDDAGGLHRREHRPLRARGRALPALHLAHPALPGPGRPPAAQGGLGEAQRRRRAEDAIRRPSPSWRPCRSDRERASMQVEREIASYYAALFMKDQVGEEFDGVVAAVTELRPLRRAAPLRRRGAGQDGGPAGRLRARPGPARDGRPADQARLPRRRRDRGGPGRLQPRAQADRPAAGRDRRGRPGTGWAARAAAGDAPPRRAGAPWTEGEDAAEERDGWGPGRDAVGPGPLREEAARWGRWRRRWRWRAPRRERRGWRSAPGEVIAGEEGQPHPSPPPADHSSHLRALGMHLSPAPALTIDLISSDAWRQRRCQRLRGRWRRRL